MTNKICFVDLDGVVADNSIRANKAHKAKTDFLGEIPVSKLQEDPGISKEAERVFWKIMFTPDLVDLDTPIPGAVEALERLEKDYRVMYLSSRPEAMRQATEAWLHKHYLAEDATRSKREIILKAPGFQYVKTVTWKVGMIQQLAFLYEASHVLFVDDEEKIREAVWNADMSDRRLYIAGSLPEAVKVLGE